MFETLAVEMKELGELDARDMADDELSEALVELSRLRRSLEAAQARLAAEWDVRRVWAADGAKAGSAWLARRTGEPKAACGSMLWRGRRAAEVSPVGQAWAAGEIGADHVTRLAKARNPRTAETFDQDVDMLVGFARRLTFTEFCQVLDYWKLHVDPDGCDESEMERRNRRRVSLDETIGGLWSGSILLDPVSGEVVHGELSRLEQQLFDQDWAEAKQRLGRDPKLHELARTPDQRRADALVEMARRSSRPDAGRPARPLFTVVLGADEFRHLCELASGTVISPAALLPWLDEAAVERILFAGTASRPIEVSRKRLFQGALRRVIEVRDRRCYHDYCDEPASRCQVDHVQPWTQGGLTAHENGRLACGHHNRLRNQRPPPEHDDEADYDDERPLNHRARPRED